MPERPITVLARESMDSVRPMQLPRDVTIPFPKLAVTYPEGMLLDRAQQLALRIIADSAGERPIFFSSSAGMMTDLGLDRWGVRHGLTTKLELRNLETDPNEGLVQGSPEYGAAWYDLEQSLTLYDDVYLFRGLRDRDIWPDRTTVMMPYQYYVMALQLSNVVELSGGAPEVVQALEEDAAAFRLTAAGGIRGAPDP